MVRKRKPDNVASLWGAVPAHGVPDPDIIDLLAKLTRLAKAGATGGVALAWIGPSQTMHTEWAGRASSHDFVALGAMLNHRIMAAWLDGSDEPKAGA